MARSSATTVGEYIKSLPKERATIVKQVRKVIKANLDKGIQETVNWGMISYEIPLKTYPDTYNKQPLQFAAIASQKNHLSLYLMCAYDAKIEALLKKGFESIQKKPNMGKSCIRFKSLDDIPLEAIGRVIKKFTMKQYIKLYESSRK